MVYEFSLGSVLLRWNTSGSAVAVAAGIVDFSLGTDTAGSGRIPAGMNGIVGLKHHGDGAWSVDLGDGGVHRIGRTYLHDVKAIMHRA